MISVLRLGTKTYSTLSASLYQTSIGTTSYQAVVVPTKVSKVSKVCLQLVSGLHLNRRAPFLFYTGNVEVGSALVTIRCTKVRVLFVSSMD